MTWNYRILKKKYNASDKEFFIYSLHEVYYDKTGKPDGYTTEPISFVSDDLGMEDTDYDPVEDLIKSLEMALRNAKEKPVLDIDEFWPNGD